MQSIMKYIHWMEEQEKKLQRKRGSQQAADRRPEKKQPRRRSLGDVALLNRTKQVEAAKPDDDRGADSAFDGGDLGESTKVVNILDNLHQPNSEHAKDSVGELIEKVVEQQADLMSNMNNDKARQKMINIETLNQIGNSGYSRSEFHANAAALPKRKLSLDEYKHPKQIHEGRCP
ncbi:conserved hypothetical protein [Trichinella spiralis]|uniref:hypothetical protein n=1 Tax=Trichinella spiralis TaxID=6334 RepID=UPI0001EFD477|nr:conserved hypothetical protein [Trichinella spiralis]